MVFPCLSLARLNSREDLSSDKHVYRPVCTPILRTAPPPGSAAPTAAGNLMFHFDCFMVPGSSAGREGFHSVNTIQREPSPPTRKRRLICVRQFLNRRSPPKHALSVKAWEKKPFPY